MRVIRLILKIAFIPVVMIVTVIQWMIIFLISFSSIVFNLIAGLFLMVAVLSYLMGLCTGSEMMRMITIGFVAFMVPVIGEWILTVLIAVKMGMRELVK